MHDLANSDRADRSFVQQIAPMAANLFLDASHLCNLLEMAQSDIMSDILSRRSSGKEEETLLRPFSVRPSSWPHRSRQQPKN